MHNLLQSDEGPFPFYDREKEELVVPEKPVQKTAKYKIVLYLEFTSLLDVLKQALGFEGINAVFITGKSVTKKRTETFNKFATDNSCRVLVLSSAGTAGLNLDVAKFIIFMVRHLYIFLAW